jgi:ketosteroid isomerase-like protein
VSQYGGSARWGCLFLFGISGKVTGLAAANQSSKCAGERDCGSKATTLSTCCLIQALDVRGAGLMMLKTTLCLPIVLVFISLSATAERAVARQLEETIRRQADVWDLAIVNKDRRAISDNMADSFMLIDSDGTVADKDQFIEGIVSEDLAISPYEVGDFKIRIYGNAAIVTGTTDMHGTYKGKPFTSNYRYSDTYVNENGTWKVVHVQTTRIKEQ